MDLDAGRRRVSSPGRRQLLKGGVAGFLLTAAGSIAAAPKVLTPAISYSGARLLRQVDPQGMPALQGQAFGPMTLFVFPVAVAAGPQEFYVADAGLSALFRYDMAMDVMNPVPGVSVSQQTRIAMAPDGSVLVTEGRFGPARRYSRAGRQLQAIEPMNTGSRFDEILVDVSTGRYIGLDRVQRRIEEIHPLGRSGVPLPEGLLPQLPVAVALDRQTLYAAGQDCRCVVAVDLSRRDRQVLAEDLAQVTAMAAGDGWLVVADGVERTLRIYREGILRSDPDYGSLGLFNPMGMSIARSTLYVADAGARRVSTFRLRS